MLKHRNMLELQNLSKTYKKQTVFEGLNHQFETGVTIITGPSGVGKSTLLRLCATVEKPSQGACLWQDRPTHKHKRLFRKILGYAPQQIDFPEDLSGLDFLRHIGALKNLSYKDATDQGEVLLEKLGLFPDKDKIIQAYSGGMRRRLGLAQAFLGAPECLIIDEPTAELDSVTANIVNRLIFDHASKAVIIMTTHLAESMSHLNYETLDLGAAIISSKIDA